MENETVKIEEYEFFQVNNENLRIFIDNLGLEDRENYDPDGETTILIKYDDKISNRDNFINILNNCPMEHSMPSWWAGQVCEAWKKYVNENIILKDYNIMAFEPDPSSP